ncbi:hypothetical protein Bca101_059301 [Brassica carinata]
MVVSRRRRTQVKNPRSMADDSDSELDMVCEECSSGKQPAKLLLCYKCDKGFIFSVSDRFSGQFPKALGSVLRVLNTRTLKLSLLLRPNSWTKLID